MISIFDDKPSVLDFPLHCLPYEVADAIVNVCEAQSLPKQFVATSALWTISTLAGRRYQSDFNGGGRNIMYCLLVAPVSVGKTPSVKVCAEEPLKDAYKWADAEFAQKMEDYLHSLKDKEKANHQPRPKRYIPITAEATTEGIINKHISQPVGVGVYYDEAESIFSAGNYKSNNDAISFFTSAFAGNRFQQIRADEDKERVIPNVNVNIIMGTQPERLGNVFTPDRLSSGFASRFLIVTADYQELNTEIDPFGQKMNMGTYWKTVCERLFYDAYNNLPSVDIEFLDAAKDVYRRLNRQLLIEANQRILSRAENYIIGAEAKLTAYFPRLCQILAIMRNPELPVIDPLTVNNAFEIYRYYQASSIAAITGMKTQQETGLPAELENLYQLLPDEFTAKDATDVCNRLGLNPRRFEISIRHKEFGALFRKRGRGTYQKL